MVSSLAPASRRAVPALDLCDKKTEGLCPESGNQECRNHQLASLECPGLLFSAGRDQHVCSFRAGGGREAPATGATRTSNTLLK